ncbi:Lipoprotein signal peptidase [hydrothermal vent metagenome]|uniref:Lipoprotein signal peptidase n=1 Tax=hydrothermal vent metagenome TaxID=652676 RepID=A0A3B0ZW41_9ZZZZ
MNSKNIIDKIGMLKWLWITVILFILDQVTKQWAESVLIKFNPVEVVSNLNLYLAYNKGAAFSFLSDAGGWQRWFFTTIAIVVSVALIYWMKTLKSHERSSAIGLAFILSGAIGNVTDRILFGHVIDFIQFYYQADSCLPGFSYYSLMQTGQCIWPAFNIADSAIAIGATILIFLALKEAYQDWKHKRQAD